MSDLLKTHMDTIEEGKKSIVENAFTEKCECFDKIKFDFPLLYDEYDPEQYAEEVTKKLDSYIDEVVKHTQIDSVDTRPCYRKHHSTGLVLLKSFKKHRNTLRTIRASIYGKKLDHTVSLGRHVLQIDKFVQLYEQNCSHNISNIRGYKSADSIVETTSLINSLKNHKSSLCVLRGVLNVLKNGRNSTKNVSNQLENNPSPPI